MRLGPNVQPMSKHDRSATTTPLLPPTSSMACQSKEPPATPASSSAAALEGAWTPSRPTTSCAEIGCRGRFRTQAAAMPSASINREPAAVAGTVFSSQASMPLRVRSIDRAWPLLGGRLRTARKARAVRIGDRSESTLDRSSNHQRAPIGSTEIIAGLAGSTTVAAAEMRCDIPPAKSVPASSNRARSPLLVTWIRRGWGGLNSPHST